MCGAFLEHGGMNHASKGLAQRSEARVSPRPPSAVAGYFDAIGRMGGPGGQEGEAQ